MKKIMILCILTSMSLFSWGLGWAYHFSLIDESYNCSAGLSIQNDMSLQDSNTFSAAVSISDYYAKGQDSWTKINGGANSFISKQNDSNNLEYRSVASARFLGWKFCS